MGLKRCFVLVIVSAVGGILGNNIFNKNATLESTTPVFGLIGYLLSYFFVYQSSLWKYYCTEKVQMLFLMALMIFLYLTLAVDSTNINVLSNVIGMAYGFFFQLADPGENNPLTCHRVIIIFMMSGVLSVCVIQFFFHSDPGPI